MIAGVVASPSAFDPVAHPAAARQRRDIVLRRMLEQGLIAREQYDTAVAEPVRRGGGPAPARGHASTPTSPPGSSSRSSTSSAAARPARARPSRAACGPDHDRLALQKAADDAINAWLPTGRAARLARGDRQPDRRGARDGRRRRLQHQAVQPRHAGPAPAGVGVQAVRARGGAQAGHLAGLHLGLAKKVFDVPAAARSSRSRTTRTPTPERPRSPRRRRPPTTPSSPRSASRSAPSRIARLARRMGIRTPVSATGR